MKVTRAMADWCRAIEAGAVLTRGHRVGNYLRVAGAGRFHASMATVSKMDYAGLIEWRDGDDYQTAVLTAKAKEIIR